MGPSLLCVEHVHTHKPLICRWRYTPTNAATKAVKKTASYSAVNHRILKMSLNQLYKCVTRKETAQLLELSDWCSEKP